MFKIILAIILLSEICFAECKPVSYIKEGQPACQTGYLFSPDKELIAREAVEKYVVAQEIILKQDELIANQDKRIALEVERYANLKAANDLQNDKSMWERLAWFIGGVAVATGVIYVTRNK